MSPSERRRSRRRFLADLLFAGSGLTAAALMMRSRQSGLVPTPSGTPTPMSSACPPPPEPALPGQMAVPPGTGKLDGEVAMPQASPSPLDGDVEMPLTPDGLVAPPQPPPPTLGGKPVAPPPRSCDAPPK